MDAEKPLRVAALIDLPRTKESGGHVKCWERLASGAARSDLPLDLTVYFSGAPQTETLGPTTRIRHLPPVFSTAILKFLPYVPDHTDLAPYHPRLARELTSYDVIHTTDGFFAFAKTAERISRIHGIPLVNSFHTDTPSYARIFTRQTIEKIFGHGWFGNKLVADWRLPEKQQKKMEEKLHRHLEQCRLVLASRVEDHALAESILGRARVHRMRRGVDKVMFGPHQKNRTGIEADYNIPKGRIVLLFVGRVDIGKNIYTLVTALEKLLKEGLPLHLVVAGMGPAMEDVKKRLGPHASLPGYVNSTELARLYASADYLVVPSEVEIHSMVAVEAITSGCPVLISGKSGVDQLFNQTPAIKTVTGDAEAWAECLRTFVSNPVQREKMRVEALDYGYHHLASWQDVLAEDLFSVWQEAAAMAPGRKAQTRVAA